MQQIALLGLGLMGSAMAQSLLRAGFPLTVYNRTRERAAPLEELGAQVADTPAQAAQAAEIIIAMVSDDRASEQIWLGTDGALAAAQPGALLIESSTLSTAWVRRLAELAEARGCAFLDAPVTGGPAQAEAGELTFMVGGDAQSLERAGPALQAMGQHVVHMGAHGSGATMKLVNNLMSGVQMAALAEGLVLAERAGLNLEQVVTIITNGGPASPVVKGRAARMAARDYQTQFATRWIHKDLSYALDEGERQGVALQTVMAAHDLFSLALERGLGDQDFAAVAEAVRPPEQ